MFWRKPPPPTPCPSDILAQLVAARMIAAPETVRYCSNYSSALWEDKDTSIRVKAESLHKSWNYSDIDVFTHHEVELRPTSLGTNALIEALNFCRSVQLARIHAEKQYKGDMAALDAMEKLLKLPAAPTGDCCEGFERSDGATMHSDECPLHGKYRR